MVAVAATVVEEVVATEVIITTITPPQCHGSLTPTPHTRTPTPMDRCLPWAQTKGSTQLSLSSVRRSNPRTSTERSIIISLKFSVIFRLTLLYTIKSFSFFEDQFHGGNVVSLIRVLIVPDGSNGTKSQN